MWHTSEGREILNRVLVRLREGKRQPTRRSHRWENIIKIHRIKIG
jgi:hypothetical protein